MMRARFALPLLMGIALGGAACAAPAQTQPAGPFTAGALPSGAFTPTPGEVRASRALDAAAKMGSGEIYAFLKPFPKGADLHMHLSGAVYAETLIAEAARQGLCIASVDAGTTAPGTPATPVGQDAVRFAQPVGGQPNHCAAGQVTAASALHNQPLYDDLIDSFSMRSFVPSEGIDGHDQFFATFARFEGLPSEAGEWLDQVATRAAAQNEQYLEIMQTPSFSHAASLGNKIGWPTDAAHSITPAELADLRRRLLAAGLRQEVPTDVKEFADAEAQRHGIEHCGLRLSGQSSVQAGVEAGLEGTPARGHGAAISASSPSSEPSDAPESAACHVRIHWLYQVLRGYPPQQVFAQALLGFEVSSADPDVVGINFVMPEDGYYAMRDYHLQMQMLDYLHSLYPRVHITLHAGELAPGMVPPAGLSFHIREAIDLGHAERIGHGVDVLYEDHPGDLLREMAGKHILVEINLTSNAVILGIQGKDHPLHAYRTAHVPWALSTDDEGVSRIDLTHEYVRGVQEQGLSYLDLKRSARASLEHAFLQGESLWAAPDEFTHRKRVCAAPITATGRPSSACAAFLNANEKAGMQWELEQRFAIFEALIP